MQTTLSHHLFKYLFAIFAGMIFSQSCLIAQTFDLQTTLINAQPTPSNSPGQFRLGRYITLDPATFSLFTIFDESDAGGIDRWRDSAIDPNILFNDTDIQVVASTITLNPNVVALGPADGPTVVRFAAPANGLYQINATFLPIQQTNAFAQASVFFNNSAIPVFSETADEDGATYSSTLSLLAGNTVDFVVNAPGSKHTSLEATLTVVPEPATLFVTALGAITLCLMRRQRGAENRS